MILLTGGGPDGWGSVIAHTAGAILLLALFFLVETQTGRRVAKVIPGMARALKWLNFP